MVLNDLVLVCNPRKNIDFRPKVEFDEWCDPNNPRRIKYDDILAASRRIAGTIIRTPCLKGHLSETLNMDIYYKLESLQFTGSFKERGVRNTISNLSDEQRKLGVVSATTGNHGLAMSYHCGKMGIPCIIVMSTNASMAKMAKCQALAGAKIIVYGSNIGEAKYHAMQLSKEKKMLYVNGYDHPNVLEGQGTIGIEIIEQVPGVDAVLVAVGGGGLIAGIACAVKHLKPDTEVYGIVAERAIGMVESLRKNEVVYVTPEPSIADALLVNKVGVNSLYNIKGVVDKLVVVKEDWIMRAMLHLVDTEKFVIEGGAAITLAALMAGLFPNLKGKKVVCVFSGGNVETKILARVIERGMALEGRITKFKVTVPDRPGSMADFCNFLANMGVMLRDIVPSRTSVKGNVFTSELSVLAETRGWDHTKDLIEQIKRNYKEFHFYEVADRPGKDTSMRRGPCLAPNPVCMQK